MTATAAIETVTDPKAEARDFLFTLYTGNMPGEGEWWELRCLDCRNPEKPGPRRYYRQRTQLIDDAIRFARQWDVFIGVGFRRCPQNTDITRCPHKHKGGDHISRLPAIWVDLDVRSADEPNKPYSSQIEALDALYALAYPPKIIVSSGTGLHAYWPIKPNADLTAIEQRNQAARDGLKGDHVWNADRILRLPGTVNYKHGSPLPVTLIECQGRS